MTDDARAIERALEAAEASARSATDAQNDEPVKIPLVGARRRAREMADELGQLRRRTAELGVLSVVDLEARRNALERAERQRFTVGAAS